MKLIPKVSWAGLIRRYVYQLIILYIILGFIAVGYNSWQRVTSEKLRQVANEFHLGSINHLLKIIDEISRMEYQLSYEWVKANINMDLLPEGKQPEQLFNPSASLYIIKHHVNKALALHRQFPDQQFKGMIKRLELRLSYFEQKLQDYSSKTDFSDDLINGLRDIHAPLKQLERAHMIQREKLLENLYDRDKRDSLIFFWLVSIVLLAGFLSTRRVLKTISMILTQQLKDEQQIRVFSQVIDQIPVTVMLTDTDTNLVYVNKNFENVSGYKSAEVLNNNTNILQSGNTPQNTQREIWKTLTHGESWEGELENVKKNGEIYIENTFYSPVSNNDGVIDHYMVIKEDITLRKQQEEQILHQAHYDNLTKLPNRFLALDRLAQHLNEAQRKNEMVALLFLDLDDFKKVNDTLGHETGDKLLIDAAQRLLNVVRSSDTVARLGGDEFIVLLSRLSASADILPVVENLIHQFRQAFRIDGREMILTASVGIAVFPDDGESASDLLRNADSAMYNAKEHGRNTYSFFTEAMNDKVSRRLALEEQMHGALDREEFYLLYQPKMNLENGRIIGAEALLRWNNPMLQQVFPDEFIPVAEQTGFIVTIGEFVIRQALAMAAKWVKMHNSSFTIAVNLSPRQFRDPNLVGFIEKSIHQSELSAKCLELEITEGVLMSGHAYIDDAINALSSLGVVLAMDDFGTGYSSLSYLQNYPFNILKIDRSFINDITEDSADRELVNATIAMAHGLGLKVVAEGVETDGQLQHLKNQGCEFAQGYYFSEPISPEKFTEMLQNQDLQQKPNSQYNQ